MSTNETRGCSSTAARYGAQQAPALAVCCGGSQRTSSSATSPFVHPFEYPLPPLFAYTLLLLLRKPLSLFPPPPPPELHPPAPPPPLPLVPYHQHETDRLA
jgi:hypothetical protein